MDTSRQDGISYELGEMLIPVLDAVIIYNIPEAVSVCATLATEKHLVICRGGATTCRQTAHKGGRRLKTVIEHARAARAAGRRGSRGEDAVGQIIRAVGGRDVVTDHAPLAGGGDLG